MSARVSAWEREGAGHRPKLDGGATWVVVAAAFTGGPIVAILSQTLGASVGFPSGTSHAVNIVDHGWVSWAARSVADHTGQCPRYSSLWGKSPVMRPSARSLGLSATSYHRGMGSWFIPSETMAGGPGSRHVRV